MANAWVPYSVLDALEKIFRGFLWGGSIANRKLHLLAWEVKQKRTEGWVFEGSQAMEHSFPNMQGN